MQGMNGVELQETLAEKRCHLPVILITAHAETPITVRAVKTGAVTVLEKPCRDFELFDAIQDALARDADFRKAAACHQEIRRRMDTLSPAEKQVLDYMMEGMANKVIARRLEVSIRTIENRRQRVFEKTGTDSLAELVRLVVELRATPHLV
jgi:FixJ family two-component response regulator